MARANQNGVTYDGPFQRPELDPKWRANQGRREKALAQQAAIRDQKNIIKQQAKIEKKAQALKDAELDRKRELMDDWLNGPRPKLVIHYSEDTWQYAFLHALQQLPNVGAAIAACGQDRRTVYEEAESSLEFAQLWEDAKENGIDALEAKVLVDAMVSGNAQLLIHARKQLREGQDTMSPKGKKDDEVVKKFTIELG